MQYLRLTKYNPIFRNKAGHYKKEEWTFFAQVDTVVAGQKVTLAEYEQVESAYIDVICKLVTDAALGPYRVSDPEGEFYAEGDEVYLEQIPALMRAQLREAYWCRLTDPNGYFIYVGRDYYVYLGLPDEMIDAFDMASKRNLYLEPCISALHPENFLEQDYLYSGMVNNHPRPVARFCSAEQNRYSSCRTGISAGGIAVDAAYIARKPG